MSSNVTETRSGTSEVGCAPYTMPPDQRYAPNGFPEWPIKDGTQQAQEAGSLDNKKKGMIDSTRDVH